MRGDDSVDVVSNHGCRIVNCDFWSSLFVFPGAIGLSGVAGALILENYF